MTAYNILIVDDEEHILKALTRTFRHQQDWQVETFTRAEDALRRARSRLFDAVITDCVMPDIDGIQFLSELKSLQPDAARILLTGVVNVDTLMAAINEASAFRFFTKPWDDAQLIEAVSEGLRIKQILLENRMLAQKVRDQQQELDLLRRQRASAH